MRDDLFIRGLVVILIIGCFILSTQAQVPVTSPVEIRNSSYHPATLTVDVNTTVVWTNFDHIGHTVTSTGGFFDSGPIEQNETFNYTFTKPGTYPYGCTLNASSQRIPMQGVIIVVPGAATAGNETGISGAQAENITLLEVIAQDNNLTSLATAIGASNISQTVLSTGGPYTIFAPNDAAFLDMDNDTGAVPLTAEDTNAVLMYHVVKGRYTAEDLLAVVNDTGNETGLQTLLGDNLTVGMANGTITVSNATILAPGINASNGIVYIIDRVLIPPVPPASASVLANGTPEQNVTPINTTPPTATATPVPTGSGMQVERSIP
jgi:uncharacterized surface protein with fasciclin (FAS1) repeats/plastocyanin